MPETLVGHFLTVFSVIAILNGALGLAIVLSQWVRAELFGKPLKINGVEKAIGWTDRVVLAVLVAAFAGVTALGIWLFSNDWLAVAYVRLQTPIPKWSYVLLFPLLWLVGTQLLSWFAGWPELVRSFPRPTGKALFTQKLPWAVMGRSVTYKNVITTAAYDAGVSLEQSKLFGVFNRPVLIPWNKLSVGTSEGAVPDLVRLTFGDLKRAALVLPSESWEAIERYRPNKQP